MAGTPEYDLLIRGGTLYDGSGQPPSQGNVAIAGDRITAVGDLESASARRVIDATGLAVSPGFIDMVAFAWDVWPVDSRALSNVYQGVTLEVFAEGESPGPLDENIRDLIRKREHQYRFDIPWTSLADYFAYLESRGTGINFASFVGGSNARRLVLGESSRAPTAGELARMQEIVRQAMREGAVGLGVGLSIAPGSFHGRDELAALASAAAQFDGLVEIALRSQSNWMLEALDEALDVANLAGARLEIGHLYQSGEHNWPKFGSAVARIEAARTAGREVSASVYVYTEAWSQLSSVLPPWVHEGGLQALLSHLDSAADRERMIREMRDWQGDPGGAGWEQYLVLTGGPQNVTLLRLEPPLARYEGATLADFMRERSLTSAEEAAVTVLRENRNEAWAAFRTQSEAGLRKHLALPWVSLGSDSSSMAAEGIHLQHKVHPRTYGNAARLLGRYVRDEGVMSLQEAVRRMTSLPAGNLRIRDRGALRPNCLADVAIFDPATVCDLASFEQPHRYATGMHYVLVNGVLVLDEGKHTNALPGRVVRGPGWRLAAGSKG